MHKNDSATSGEGFTERLLLEAIARQLRVSATYNNVGHTLEPHLLFVRDGNSHVLALNTRKTWRSDESPRLGQFKTAGLVEVKLLTEPFTPLASFDGDPPREKDTPLLAVSRD